MCSCIQVVGDVVQIVNSLLQWQPENIRVASSSMLGLASRLCYVII